MCTKCKEKSKELKRLREKVKRMERRATKFKASLELAMRNAGRDIVNTFTWGTVNPFDTRRWRRNKPTSPTIRQVINRGW